ncbi:hypothetical protein FDENT_2614 [Fusarium denticulatum]|uniref:Uncharacterized protein n=1 Tax=Fusarium denticulatum TaxID=48507 RepID=A0A8H5XFJ0_9HYPO|nr:hypothetical protein FDENT_2614 [Fusarium denticulatum]
MDPFGRLPLEIREMIISNLESNEVFWCLRQASPVFWRQSQTSKLLKAWDTLQKDLGYRLFSQVLLLVKYPKIEEPILEDEHPYLLPDTFYRDPLFTPHQYLIFEMYDKYQAMLNCFALGPALVPLYRDKYPDLYLGRLRDFLARSFGENGEQLPIVMPPIKCEGIGRRIVYFLLAIDLIEQCPSAFVSSPGEPPKQRSIKEERSFMLVDHWLFMIPGLAGDFERFCGYPERSEIAEDVDDFWEQEEEEEQQREAEEMVFIQC